MYAILASKPDSSCYSGFEDKPAILNDHIAIKFIPIDHKFELPCSVVRTVQNVTPSFCYFDEILAYCSLFITIRCSSFHTG